MSFLRLSKKMTTIQVFAQKTCCQLPAHHRNNLLYSHIPLQCQTRSLSTSMMYKKKGEIGNSSKAQSTEALITLFLNTVTSAVSASVASDNPTISPHKQCFWMADWSSQCLTGLTGYQRKPDLVLVNSTIVPWDKITWLSPKVIGEYSRESFQPASRLGKTMDTKAYLVMVDQPWQHFVLGLSLANEELRVHFYDHLGGAISPSFNIHAEPNIFLFILSGVVFSIHLCIGFDMSIMITPTPYGRKQATVLLTLASGESRKATAIKGDSASLPPSLLPVLESQPEPYPKSLTIHWQTFLFQLLYRLMWPTRHPLSHSLSHLPQTFLPQCYGFSFSPTSLVTFTTLMFPSTAQPVHLFPSHLYSFALLSTATRIASLFLFHLSCVFFPSSYAVPLGLCTFPCSINTSSVLM